MDDRIPEIKSRADCRSIYKRFFPTLFIEGQEHSRCAFHEDRGPSLKLDRQGGYCFGACKQGFDAIDLYAKGAGCSKAEAIDQLSKELGITSGNGNGVRRKGDTSTRSKDGKLQERDFAKEFERATRTPIPAGASDWFERYGLMQILPELQNKKLVGFKAANETFPDTLVIPATDLSQKILGLQYIPCDGGDKKFASGTEAGTYKDRAFFTLYRGNGPVILVEGVKDAFATAASIPAVNVVSIFSAGFADKVHRLGTDTEPPILFLDADEAGRKGTEAAAKALKGRCRVVDWSQAPEGCSDPADLLAGGHTDLILRMVRQAEPWTPRRIEEEKANTTDPQNPSGGQSDVAKNSAPEPDQPPSFFGGVNLDESRAGRFLERAPEPIPCLLKDSLPLKTYGLWVSNGGTGKGFALLQFGVSVASGIPYLDGQYEVESPGKVLLIFGEDSEEIIHHRIHSVVSTLVDFTSLTEVATSLNNNLYILSVMGQDVRLTSEVDGLQQPTQAFHDLAELCKSIEGLKLVVLDPLSRFYVGNENSSSESTYFCSLLEFIAKETNAVVLCSQHTNKGSGRGQGPLYQESIRGSSGFTNASRWQMNMALLDESEAGRYGIDPGEANRYLWAKVTKKNYGPPERCFMLRRESNGVLRLEETVEFMPGEEGVLKAVLSKIAEEHSAGKRYTADAFSRTFGKEWEGYGFRKLKSLIERAVVRGTFVLKNEKNSMGKWASYLHLADQEPLNPHE